jgi:uncharacterized paraquat-inducible protein A
MALIQCPECNNTVSLKASVCPKCGFPITNNNSDSKHWTVGRLLILGILLAAILIFLIVETKLGGLTLFQFDRY